MVGTGTLQCEQRPGLGLASWWDPKGHVSAEPLAFRSCPTRKTCFDVSRLVCCGLDSTKHQKQLGERWISDIERSTYYRDHQRLFSVPLSRCRICNRHL